MTHTPTAQHRSSGWGEAPLEHEWPELAREYDHLRKILNNTSDGLTQYTTFPHPGAGR
jgi:hypothetical protein